MDHESLQISKDLQYLQIQKNQVAKEIPKTAPELREELIKKGKHLNEQIAEQKKNLSTLETEFQNLMLLVPNIAAEDPPGGKISDENVVISQWGEPPCFDFKIMDHVEILKNQGWADFD